MLTENGLRVDMEAVREVLERADVLAVAFTTFPDRLLVDVRDSGEEGPLVAIVDPVSTVEERFLWLGQHRGRFGAPEAFSFFMWPQTVRGMVERDLMAPMRSRLLAINPPAAAELDTVLGHLVQLEARAIRAACAGEEPWQTVWPRQPAA